MPHAPDTKKRFICAAASLFQQRGYHGVGLTEIIAAAQAPKGSFYHHFPAGKEELAEQAVSWAAAFVAKQIDVAFADAADFSAGVRCFTSTIAAWLENSSWTLGCPVNAIAVDGSQKSWVLTQATRTAFDNWVNRVESHALRLNVKRDARVLALQLVLAVEGAWVVARVMRSNDPLLQVAGLFADCG